MKFADIERTVTKKLHASPHEGGDRKLVIYCECGGYLGWTKVSRKPSEQVGPMIANAIPKQLGIEGVLWLEIAGCTKGWLDYQTARGHAH